MPRVPADQATAVNILTSGRVLGIGETHTNAGGRRLVMALAGLHLIRHLFVELPPSCVAAVGIVRTNGTPGVITGENFSNGVRLGEVILAAFQGNAQVHCADHNKAQMGGHMKLRNDTIKAKFDEVTKVGGTTRCVLLFGGDHFNGDGVTEAGFQPLEQSIPNMDWMDFP